MVKIDYFVITLHDSNLNLIDEQHVYQPGDDLIGTLNFRVSERLKINEVRMVVNGTGKVKWNEDGGKDQKTYSAKETYLNHKIVFVKKQEDSDLYFEEGNYSYEFKVNLPMNLATSFEHEFGQILYSINGTIDIPWAIDKHAMKTFLVMNYFDLNKTPYLNHRVEVNDSKTLCCGPCKSAPITSELNVIKSGFLPGEVIICQATIDNLSSSEIRSTKVCLIQEVTFHGLHSHHEKKRLAVREINSNKNSSLIPSHSRCEWEDIDLMIPESICPTTNNPHIIEISYKLVLSLCFSGIHSNKEISVPIVIGTKPFSSHSTKCEFFGITAQKIEKIKSN